MLLPIPYGRDWLGILGGPVGSGAAALSNTSVQYRINLNDYITEAVFRVNPAGSNPTYLNIIRAVEDGGAAVHATLVHGTTNRIRLIVGANSYYSTATLSNYIGQWVHLIVFFDRSGLAYMYVNGAYFDSVNISADAASDITSDTLELFGLPVATNHYVDGAMARLFVVAAADFPTRQQMDRIAVHRYENPWAESPVMLARTNYATERRCDVDFNDVDSLSTTVPNNGTGGNFTIGSALTWRNVLTTVSHAQIEMPRGEDWYAFDRNKMANNLATDIGCIQGSYILEAVYKHMLLRDTAAGDYMWIFYGAAGGAGFERLYCYKQTNIQRELALRSNNIPYSYLIYAAGVAEYGRRGIHVVHQVYDADNGNYLVYVNGHLVRTIPVAANLNLSGNLQIQLGSASHLDGVMALRLWNAASLPAGYAREVVESRAIYPWAVSRGPLYTAFSTMTLRANYELREGVVAATSTTIPNLVGAAGTLTISGAGTYGNSRVLAVRGIP